MIHIVGCGSVGSTVAELLARFGCEKFTLYDFEVVEPKNIANQMFVFNQIGKKKTEAVTEIIHAINPETKVYTYDEGWTDQPLDGYVFLAVDNIEVRKAIAKANLYNEFVKAMFDFRTGLTDAQHYAADWSDFKARKNFMNTMNFSHDEVESVRSACNVELCVAPTVRLICNAGVANFINFLKGEPLYKLVVSDAFNLEKGIDAVR
jgi:molybdopterin/thiamine biosynthesis adenylyltransferase